MHSSFCLFGCQSRLKRGGVERLDELLGVDVDLGDLRLLVLLDRAHDAADLCVVEVERRVLLKLGVRVVDDAHRGRADHGLEHRAAQALLDGLGLFLDVLGGVFLCNRGEDLLE